MTAVSPAPDSPPPVSRPRLTTPTLRLRVTLLVTGLVVGTGLLLLLLAYVLIARSPIAVPSVVLVDELGRRFSATLPGGEQVAEFQRAVQAETLSALVTRGGLALVVVGLVGLLLAYAVAGQVLRPVQQITATARRLSTETLDQRIALVGPQDELKELADTFDAMLGRLQEAFDAQRRFVANASHELRTPLAVMRTEVDVALADPDASVEDLRAMGQVVRAATDRADRLVDSLLLLARTDRLAVTGLEVRERVELPPLVLAALDSVRAEALQRGLRLEPTLGGAAVLGDRSLLERLAGNLVENAVRHNVDGGWVRVGTVTASGRARLVVASSGPVVDEADVEGLFQPFRRGGAARTARRGAGLGLSIVRAVAAAHGGSVAATAVPGGGLEVVVDLPRSP